MACHVFSWPMAASAKLPEIENLIDDPLIIFRKHLTRLLENRHES